MNIHTSSSYCEAMPLLPATGFLTSFSTMDKPPLTEEVESFKRALLHSLHHLLSEDSRYCILIVLESTN